MKLYSVQSQVCLLFNQPPWDFSNDLKKYFDHNKLKPGEKKHFIQSISRWSSFTLESIA